MCGYLWQFASEPFIKLCFEAGGKEAPENEKIVLKRSILGYEREGGGETDRQTETETETERQRQRETEIEIEIRYRETQKYVNALNATQKHVARLPSN